MTRPKNQQTLLPLIHKFLRLETLAHELYLMHLPHVPAFAKKDFLGFIKTEERHRRIFERLYCRVAGVRRHPRFPVSLFCLRLVAHSLRFVGFRAICRFECAIERRAIADYEQALHRVRDPKLRTIIRGILQDEKDHPSLPTLLLKFQKEEMEHIRVMQHDLEKKISTARR